MGVPDSGEEQPRLHVLCDSRSDDSTQGQPDLHARTQAGRQVSIGGVGLGRGELSHHHHHRPGAAVAELACPPSQDWTLTATFRVGPLLSIGSKVRPVPEMLRALTHTE